MKRIGISSQRHCLAGAENTGSDANTLIGVVGNCLISPWHHKFLWVFAEKSIAGVDGIGATKFYYAKDFLLVRGVSWFRRALMPICATALVGSLLVSEAP